MPTLIEFLQQNQPIQQAIAFEKNEFEKTAQPKIETENSEHVVIKVFSEQSAKTIHSEIIRTGRGCNVTKPSVFQPMYIIEIK